MDTQVIQFNHTQSISWNGERWSETVDVQVILTSAALSTAWLREHFTGRNGGTVDFTVLISIIMHSRPLRGDDLVLFEKLGLATSADEGRLYARISDVGLADELGIHRKTIAASARRLAAAGFIAVLDLPDGFRDSRGRFSGNKAYLVSGDMARYLPKIVTSDDDAALAHRDTPVTTVAPNRGSLTATADPKNASTVAVEVPYRGSSTATNINDEEDEEGEEEFLEKIATQQVFARFALLLGREYTPTQKDRKLLRQLSQDGYRTGDVMAGMVRVQENRGGRMGDVQSFAYVVPEIRRRPPARPVSGQEDEAQPPVPAPGKDTPLPNSQPVPAPVTLDAEAEEIPADVERAFCAVMRREITPVERQRLAWLHEELVALGGNKLPNGDPWQRILTAIKFQLNPDARNPTSYLHKLLIQPLEEPEKTTKRRKTRRGERRPDTPKTGLARAAGENHPPIQIGAMTITRPPERPSGYVVPSEAARRDIYDAVAALRALERQMKGQNKTVGGDRHG
ncbi:MAG: hypothetical protein D6694_00960 [Gammaproteobacteria bacterium]|nr:MAG: hypothetical protein D6694_00960 [Gammaproteobacteria bacterium]